MLHSLHAEGNSAERRAVEVTAASPCPVPGCGATSGCRVDAARRKVACLHRGGPLAKSSRIKETGKPCFVHELEWLTGRVLEPPPDELARFLSAVFDDGDQVTVRPTEAWEEGGKKKARVLWDAVLNVTAKSLREKPQHWTMLLGFGEREHANVFFGVCPRFGSGGRFELAWQMRLVRVLWADLDSCTPEEALARCERAELPRPSVVVRSGHGVHFYWRLAEPYLIDDAGDPAPVKNEWVMTPDGKKRPRKFVVASDGERHYLYRWDEKTGADANRPNPAFPFGLSDKARRLQDIVGGIASKIGGDHTNDLARLLRLPGTLNRKDERNGKPPVPCELVECDPARRYPISTFARFAEAAPDKIRREKVAQIRFPSGGRFQGRRLDGLNAKINACAAAPVGQRSEADFALCAYAIEKGLDAERVWSEVQTVGKFGEKGRGYFDRTWEAAAGKTREKIYIRMERKAAKASPSANGKAGGHGDGGADESAGDGPDDDAVLPNEEDADPHRLARQWLLHQGGRQPPSHVAYYREQVHQWAGTHWTPTPDAEIKAILARFCKRELDQLNKEAVAEHAGDGPPPTVPKVTTTLVNNVLQAVAGERLLPSDTPRPSWLGDKPGPRNWIALRNGILDVDALLAGDPAPLRPHAHLWFSPTCLPYDFDPAAACPRWEAFLARNLGDDAGKGVLLQEWAGYVVTHDTSLQKWMIFVGDGANGKSVVLAVFLALLGEENVSTVPLELFGDKFRLAGTIGKLANMMADTGEIDKTAEGLLKAFIVGDPIEVEQKFKQAYRARPTARLMLSTNNAPQFSDKSDGIWRRMLLMPFVVQILEAEQIKGMDKPGWWEAANELPGVLNWALAGLHRLRSQGGVFTVPPSCREAADKLRTDSNPARRFLLEECRIDLDGISFKSRVYSQYSAWCKAHGHCRLAENRFAVEVFRAYPTVEAGKDSPDGDGRRAPIYRGLALNDPLKTYATGCGG